MKNQMTKKDKPETDVVHETVRGQGDHSHVGSLRLEHDGMWRFRWAVAPGIRSIQCAVKQQFDRHSRPELVVCANPAVGPTVDTVVVAPISDDWVVLGPATIVATASGYLWVQLRNLTKVTAEFDFVKTT